MHTQTGLSSTPALRCVCMAALLAMAAGSATAQRDLRIVDVEPMEPLPRVGSGSPIIGNPPPGAAPPLLPAPVAQPALPPAAPAPMPAVTPPAPTVGPPAVVALPPPPPSAPVVAPAVVAKPIDVDPRPKPVPPGAGGDDPQGRPGQGAGFAVTDVPPPQGRLATPPATTVAPPPMTTGGNLPAQISTEPPRITAPSGPSQGTGPTPATPQLVGPATTAPSIGGAPSALPPGGGAAPQGAGIADLTGGIQDPIKPQSQELESPHKKPPPQGAAAGNPNGLVQNARAGLGEVLPSAHELSASMLPANSIAKPHNPQAAAAAQVAQPACVPVTFRPDPSRAAITLVDFSGDGLIVSAIPNTHVNMVFARAGYRPIDIQQPVRWCVAQTAARELLGPSPAANQHASLLVQVGANWQLMSHEQWLAHQASMKPAPAAPLVSSAPKAVQAAAKRVGRVPIARSAGRSGFFSPLPRLR